MFLNLNLQQNAIDKKNLLQFFLSKNPFQKEIKWSDKEAEFASHIEILNQSALVSISDLKGNIIHANELFCAVSKYRLDEILYKPHSIIRHPDTPPSVFKEMWKTIGNGRVWQGEIKNRAKDGSDYWVIATVAPVIGMNGKPVKYISIRYDITKQKQAEKELSLAKNKIDNELLENITYAKHIHGALLCNKEETNFPEDSFLIYKAQKMISGDFYKIERKENKLIVVIGDSTGHGISASYISVLVLNTLARVMETCCGNPGKILKMINKELNKITRFNSGEHLTESADMMACCVDKKELKLKYASAKMRALIIRNAEIILLEKDKCTIGETHEDDFKIKNRSVDLQHGDRLYIFSDGIIDQFGGDHDKRIGIRNILSILKDSAEYPMPVQKKFIEEALRLWQGDNEQTDDMTIFGLKI